MARRSDDPAAPVSEVPQPREDCISLEALRDDWRCLYKQDPPRISRDLLVLSLAYRRQELAQGGLTKATLRKLQSLGRALRDKGRVAVVAGPNLKPGTRLVREWRGRSHTVTMTEGGFDYEGVRYASLTKIANRITGAHWSGPRFFGLSGKRHGDPANGGSDG